MQSRIGVLELWVMRNDRFVKVVVWLVVIALLSLSALIA